MKIKGEEIVKECRDEIDKLKTPDQFCEFVARVLDRWDDATNECRIALYQVIVAVAYKMFGSTVFSISIYDCMMRMSIYTGGYCKNNTDDLKVGLFLIDHPTNLSCVKLLPVDFKGLVGEDLIKACKVCKEYNSDVIVHDMNYVNFLKAVQKIPDVNLKKLYKEKLMYLAVAENFEVTLNKILRGNVEVNKDFLDECIYEVEYDALHGEE